MAAPFRIPLLSGAYQAESIIADAQRCVNLYPEVNPGATQIGQMYGNSSGAPVPMTHYPTPGLTLLGAAADNVQVVRCLYRATNGAGYAVIGKTAYAVSAEWELTGIGTVGDLRTPCYMADNGLVVVLVDGTSNGYAIRMADNAFAAITDPSFYGGTAADYDDSYFIFNRPGTDQWYISLSFVDFDMLTGTVGAIYQASIAAGGTGYTNGTYPAQPLTGGSGTGATADITVAGGAVTAATLVSGGAGYQQGDVLSANLGGSGFAYDADAVHGHAFDPLDIVAKQSGADPCQRVFALNRVIWTLGTLTGDTYYNSGASDFTFQALPGSLEHGIAAPYSLAKQDTSAYWLSQDRTGQAIVLQTNGQGVERISTHAIENAFQQYARIDDAIGFTYQQNGHTFYFLTFPGANATWVYDIGAMQWHQRASVDLNGILGRHRANCYAFLHGKNVVGDWQNGRLYAFDLEAYTDDGLPITRIRSFPHVLNNGNRLIVTRFTADMEAGAIAGVAGKSATPTFAISSTHTITIGAIDGKPALVFGSVEPAQPMVTLRTSLTRGATWGNGVMQSLGASGQYDTSLQWRRLGMARDFVFELSWSIPAKTALQGAWIEALPAAS